MASGVHRMLAAAYAIGVLGPLAWFARSGPQPSLGAVACAFAVCCIVGGFVFWTVTRPNS